MKGEGTRNPRQPHEPGGVDTVDFPALIRLYRQRTGRSLVDLADDAHVGVGHVISVAKDGSAPRWVRERIFREITRHVSPDLNGSVVDIAW